VGHLLRLARPDDTEVGGPLVEGSDSSVDVFVGRFQRIFQGLAQEIRAARRALRENEHLRAENHELRQALRECVESCGRYLTPLLEDRDGDPERDDHARARDAVERGRRLLDDGRLRLRGPG
jgi:hypothetical protein